MWLSTRSYDLGSRSYDLNQQFFQPDMWVLTPNCVGSRSYDLDQQKSGVLGTLAVWIYKKKNCGGWERAPPPRCPVQIFGRPRAEIWVYIVMCDESTNLYGPGE